jgi:hypothetical protein
VRLLIEFLIDAFKLVSRAAMGFVKPDICARMAQIFHEWATPRDVYFTET